MSNSPSQLQAPPAEYTPSPPATPNEVAFAAKPAWRLGRSRVIGWLFVLALLVAWQITSKLADSPTFPVLTDVLGEWWHQIRYGDLLEATGDTLEIMFIGLAISSAAGILVGVLIARVRFLYLLLEPTLELLRPVPVAAYIPVLILYFGIGNEMKLWVIVIAAFFPMLLNAEAGARAVPPTMRETALSFRLSWLQTLREIVIPFAAPHVFVGFRQALATSLIVAVITGMIAGNSGLGYYLVLAQQNFDVTLMFVGALTVAVVGYALNWIVSRIERRLLHWHVGAELRAG